MNSRYLYKPKLADLRRFRIEAEELCLAWWFTHPWASIRFSWRDMHNKPTRDLCKIMQANFKKNNNEFISYSECIDALYKNERFNYLLEQANLNYVLSVFNYDIIDVGEGFFRTEEKVIMGEDNRKN